MPIATTEQYAGMLAGAAAGGRALAGVNVSSSETLNAAPRGFAQAQADGIPQVSTGGGEFLSGTAVKDMVAGARALAVFARVLVEPCLVLVALHSDHCPPDSGMGQKKAHDPSSWGREAEAAMATGVAQACEQLGSAGRSLLR